MILNHRPDNIVCMYNMKLVNENTPKEMINLRMNCLKRGLSDFKMKSLEKDRKQ